MDLGLKKVSFIIAQDLPRYFLIKNLVIQCI